MRKYASSTMGPSAKSRMVTNYEQSRPPQQKAVQRDRQASELADAMALSCLKYSLAFLLGAVALGLFIALQLQRDVIRVEIHWKSVGSSTASPSGLGNHDFPYRAEKLVSDPIIPVASKLDTSSKHTSTKYTEDSLEVTKQLQKVDPLSRRARQLPSGGLGRLEAPGLTSKSHQRNRAAINTKHRKSGEEAVHVTPIEDALSQTAPDWVGLVIPSARLPDVEQCSDKFCSEYLSEAERSQFDECIERTVRAKDQIGSVQSDDTCHFQNGTNRHPVALASFQGSGNTWMRGLLQKITGICTG